MRPTISSLLRRARQARRSSTLTPRAALGALLDYLFPSLGRALPPDVPTSELLDARHAPHRIESPCQETVGAGDLIPRIMRSTPAPPAGEWRSGSYDRARYVSIPGWDDILERASIGPQRCGSGEDGR